MATLDQIEDRLVTYLGAASSIITAAPSIPAIPVAAGTVRFIVTAVGVERDHAAGLIAETYRFRLRGVRLVPIEGADEAGAIEDIKTVWAAIVSYLDARLSLGGLVNMARITAIDFDPFNGMTIGNQMHIFVDIYVDVVTKSAMPAQV